MKKIRQSIKDIEELKDTKEKNIKWDTLMTEIVIALLLIVNGEIKEHRIQDLCLNCLKR